MSPRTGRPTEAPKRHRLEIRLTDGQAEMLDECARELKATKTDVIIKGVEMVNAEMKKVKD